jgi:hypothetical protein
VTDYLRSEIRRRFEQGATNKEIAIDYGVSMSTAARHRKRLGKSARKADGATIRINAPEITAALAATARYFRLTVERMVDERLPDKRTNGIGGSIRTARRAAALVLVDTVEASYPTTAKALGRNDHTTAMTIVDSARLDPVASEAARVIAAELTQVTEARAA